LTEEYVGLMVCALTLRSGSGGLLSGLPKFGTPSRVQFIGVFVLYSLLHSGSLEPILHQQRSTKKMFKKRCERPQPPTANKYQMSCIINSPAASLYSINFIAATPVQKVANRVFHHPKLIEIGAAEMQELRG
jgi:hypothetical protein